SIIVSSIFARADSHKIYFVDLTASAMGVVYPIIAVSYLKSENTLLVLSILPLVFIIILMFSVKNLFIRIPGVLASVAAIACIIFFLKINLSTPWEIKTSDYNEKVLPEITSPIDKSILDEVYVKSDDG